MKDKNKKKKEPPKLSLPSEDKKLLLSVSSRNPNLASNESTPSIDDSNRRYNFGISTIIMLFLVAFAVWRSSQSAATIASTATPVVASATSALSTPTTSPTETAIPTEMITPTIPAVAVGVGGADQIALTASKDIYLMDINGKNIRALTNTNLSKFDLQWLPGGNELLYGEGKCVYKLDVTVSQAKPEEVACFTDSKFEGFRVSPDGKYVAISIDRRLIISSFDLDQLSKVKSVFELQASGKTCLDYTDVAVKSAQWSNDGKRLAILYQTVVRQRLGDRIRVIAVDLERCDETNPLIIDEIPNKYFVPDGYENNPILPSYTWDGNQLFLFNTFKRNSGYGELYLYNMSTTSVRKIDPINDVCCYRDPIISPDGKYFLLFFQDVRRGADSETQMYYIPGDQVGTNTVFTPIKLPLRFFPDPRENLEVALRPSVP